MRPFQQQAVDDDTAECKKNMWGQTNKEEKLAKPPAGVSPFLVISDQEESFVCAQGRSRPRKQGASPEKLNPLSSKYRPGQHRDRRADGGQHSVAVGNQGLHLALTRSAAARLCGGLCFSVLFFEPRQG